MAIELIGRTDDNNDTPTNGNGGNGGGEGDNGKNGNAGGDGGGGDPAGAGGNGGNGQEFQLTDADKSFLGAAKQVFGEDPMSGLQQVSQFASKYKELQPYLDHLNSNPGHRELLNYLRNGGKDINLFQEMQTLEADKIDDLEALIRKTMYETQASREQVEGALKYQFGIGDEFASANQGEKFAKELQLRQQGAEAKKWLAEFQQRTLNPEPAAAQQQKQLSEQDVAAIFNEWKPLYEKSPFAISLKREVEAFDKSKLPISFEVANDEQISSDITARLQQLAAAGIRPNEKNAQAILQEVSDWAKGKHFDRLFQSFADALGRQFNELVGEKFYGIPRNRQAPSGGGNANKIGNLELLSRVGSEGTAQPMDF